MTLIAGVFGFFIGLAAHDIAVQALTDTEPLRPGSGTCPQCLHRRGWLRLRCPECGRHVQREPVVAVVTALFGAGLYNLIGANWALIPFFGFMLLTAALMVSDLEEFRIVDRLNIRGSAILAVTLALAALADGTLDAMLRGLGGAVAYFAGATVLFLVAGGRGFGAGDVKLAPVLGLFTTYISWGVLAWSVFATAVIGGVIAFGMIIAGAAKMKTELPYGPPMIIGSWVALVLAGLGSIPIPS